MNVRTLFSSLHPWRLSWQRRRAKPKEVPCRDAARRPAVDVCVLFIRIPY